MASRICRAVNACCKLRVNLQTASQNHRNSDLAFPTHVLQARQLHTTLPQNDIMEFFDDKKNWGAQTVKVGRSWTKEELRIKSNSDLHKLWYVLLKEKNMLLTMEHACKEECEVFPNPERLDKVEDSMENLEDVVRERNKAYYELETTETGEAPTVNQKTPFGKLLNRQIKEYPIPKHMNKNWQDKQIHIKPEELTKFNSLYREILNNVKRRELSQRRSRVKQILTYFPHADEEAIKEQYPGVDVKAIKNYLKRYF